MKIRPGSPRFSRWNLKAFIKRSEELRGNNVELKVDKNNDGVTDITTVATHDASGRAVRVDRTVNNFKHAAMTREREQIKRSIFDYRYEGTEVEVVQRRFLAQTEAP